MNKITPPVTVNGVNYLIDEKLRGNEGFNYNLALNSIDKLSRNYPRFTSEQQFCVKIVGVEYPNTLEGVPQYKLPDEDENDWIKTDKICGDILNNYLQNKPSNHPLFEVSLQVLRDLIFLGYKANKAKWTDEDIRTSYQEGAFDRMIVADEISPKQLWIKNGKRILQSLNNSGEIESIEYFTEDAFQETQGEITGTYLKLNAEGLLHLDVTYK